MIKLEFDINMEGPKVEFSQPSPVHDCLECLLICFSMIEHVQAEHPEALETFLRLLYLEEDEEEIYGCNVEVNNKPPEPMPRLGLPQFIYDQELCKNIRELETCLQTINESGWEIISVTEPTLCVFHVFFRRPSSV